MKEWFEDPRFWSEAAPILFDAPRWERAPAEVDGTVALLGVGDGASILDLCCGPGRHALELHRRGFVVTGVDLCVAYLAQAREAEPAIEWVEADMRAFVRPAAFDAAINLFTSFGYFRDPADDLRVARNVRCSLRAGGRFLLDVAGKEVMARKHVPRRFERHEDGTIFLVETRILDGWRAREETWTLLREGAQRTLRFFQRLYSGVELEALLLRAGFAAVAPYGGLDGRPYDDEASRLVAVART